MKILRADLAPGFLAVLSSCALGASLVAAHDNHAVKKAPPSSEIDDHWKLDFGFPGFKELNARLQHAFDEYKEPTTADMFVAMARAAAAAAPDAHLVGSWSPVLDSPVLAIHTTVLTDGRVLFWDSVSDLPAENSPTHNFTRAAVWNPSTGALTRVDNTTTGYNLFCSGFAHLPDGRPLLAGGNLNSSLAGTQTLHFFDHLTDQWSVSPLQMVGQRWYPSVTPLGNGEMLITSGGPSTHEVFTTAGTLRALSTATLAMPLYPWLHAATNGDALFFGPDNRMDYLNTSGTGAWRALGARDGANRSYGSFAMFDLGRVLAVGGGASLRSSVVIDFMNPNLNPVVSAAPNMVFGRRQHNLTVLPDGTVLATGGNSSGAPLVDLNAGVYAAELWNPTTGLWTTLSSAARTRQYHSTAILLPDGRVFTGGGGICGTCYSVGYLEKNYEVFSPPYLFRKDGSGELAPRPDILSAPSSVFYDQAFSISTSAPGAIRQVVMMRVSSVTHSVDFEQRRIPLRYSVGGGVIQTRAPANSNVAPPGFYMLFLIDDQDVPSVAQMVEVQHSGLGAPILVSATAASGSVTLSWVPVHGATSYMLRGGTSPGVYPSSASVGNVTTFTAPGIEPGIRYYFVVAATNGGATGGNSNELWAEQSAPPPPPPPPPSGTGLSGSYYSGTSFNTLRTTRLDPQVNFTWAGSPAGGVGVDNFTVRWTGTVEAPVTGTYTFYTTSDDGVRLWVNGTQLVDNWTTHSATVDTGSIGLTAGIRVPITMEFFDAAATAVAKLEWSAPGVPRAVVPKTRLQPGVTNVARNRPATQSTTVGSASASRAVDGNTNGDFAANSVTQTASTLTPWWRVDLGTVRNIESIRVWNRTDCCSTRLSNFRVFVSDVAFTSSNLNSTINQPGVSNYQFVGSFTGSTTFAIGRTGRYVRVQLEGTNYLSLAEVEVNGTPR